MRLALLFPALAVAFIVSNGLYAQNPPKTTNLVYVDPQGVLRWTKNKAEASFFGVNYTLPFAYSYRAHKALHADLEQAIRQDVYHLARLGLDAFRVHVWDTEISDSLGNLLENDHLRLFDFLVAELERRKIRVLITPIAFWGNGYPEKDERTPGFSRVYGKGKATSMEAAIKAQEHYLQQFFKHVNPYTKLTYGTDPDVIAVELNNEPSHSGPKSGVTDYINRLAAAVRSTGWTKPLYYNISQSPYYSDAVAKAAIDGVSFQWYPSGLVGGEELKGNALPNVDRYLIPFDTVPAFRNKSRMVYEFDAADVLQSNMYPAMAKSFRAAGFQWATQFAYDPMALAYANTEYQTHYLNLAYTPSKAISMLIASAVFHKLPRGKDYGTWPGDSVFDAFRVSYKEALSEMNTDRAFYYSNTTTTRPLNRLALTHLAGVGSSPAVRYGGSGAYFLDKVEEGVWRLELMPDVIYIRDPFERPSPSKEVTRVQWDRNPMRIILPDLGQGFSIKGLNEGNAYSGNADADSLLVGPGTYLLVSRQGKAAGKDVRGLIEKNGFIEGKDAGGAIRLNEFVAPSSFSTELLLRHEPFTEVTPGRAFTIAVKVAGFDTGRAALQISRASGGQPRLIPMLRNSPVDLSATVPAEMVIPGELNYRIILQKGKDFTVFPGNSKGDPFAWDNINNETWKTFVAAENGRLEIFNPSRDKGAWIFPSFRRGFQSAYSTGERTGTLILRVETKEMPDAHGIGFQYAFSGKLRGREQELGSFGRLMIRARSTGDQPRVVKIVLTDADAFSFSTEITLSNEFRDVEVPLTKLNSDSMWIMPRPYPGFQPLLFKGAGNGQVFKLGELEKIQISVPSGVLEVESVWMAK